MHLIAECIITLTQCPQSVILESIIELVYPVGEVPIDTIGLGKFTIAEPRGIPNCENR